MAEFEEVVRSVSRDQLERLVAAVGEREGWDFSRVRMARDPEPWDYQEIVRRYLRPSDRVLDVGTGGGELFLSLADAFGEGVGVDMNPAMIEVARKNLPSALSDRVRFEVTARTKLEFEPESFDVVLNRHASTYPEAIERVLRPGGWFIWKGLGERQNEKILESFGWDYEYVRRNADPYADHPIGPNAIARDLERLGCEVVVTGNERNRAWFRDLESLVFYLRAVPFPEPLVPARHFDAFNRYLAANAGPNGYEDTEHGTLLIARKQT